jgi:hypothetical protein
LQPPSATAPDAFAGIGDLAERHYRGGTAPAVREGRVVVLGGGLPASAAVKPKAFGP